MLVLGIESSCDETGVALYSTEHGLIGNQLHTQMAMHAEYGGVVPELAKTTPTSMPSPTPKAPALAAHFWPAAPMPTRSPFRWANP